MKALRDHVNRNGGTASTTKIKHSRTPRKETKEVLDARFINPSSRAAVSIPRHCMTLVMGYNLACWVIHRTSHALSDCESDAASNGSEIGTGSTASMTGVTVQ